MASVVIHVMLGLFLATVAHSIACPTGWMKWRDSCYTLMPTKTNWSDAWMACDRILAHMTVVNTQEEQDFVWREMRGKMVEIGAKIVEDIELWIGCRDIDNTGHLLCLGDKSDAHYKNWYQPENEPNNADHHCVRMADKYNSSWGDCDCSSLKFTACEKEAFSYSCGRTTRPYNLVPRLCLLNHEIMTYPVRHSTECGPMCTVEPQCQSFNIIQEGKKMTCQLNDVTQANADVTDVVFVENCYLYEQGK